MFKFGQCKVCETDCFWIEFVDGELAEMEVCSLECLEKLQQNKEDDPIIKAINGMLDACVQPPRRRNDY